MVCVQLQDLLDVLATLQEPLSAPDQQLKLSTIAQVGVVWTMYEVVPGIHVC